MQKQPGKHHEPKIVFSLSKINLPLTYRPFTYVKRGVARPSKIIYVGNPKRLDGHRAHTKEQLSAGHEQPQVVSVGQTSGLIAATRLRDTRVRLKVANVMAIWIIAGGHTRTERAGQVGKKRQLKLITC